ncbi:hypothetical protein ABZ567_14455 [Streptomyces sp. NPDC016459]|uniref:hypothetical protein n=1 Tax=Streptomyces sp. NPDC016459 TaxID=3157190 RepID=UPI0033E6F400
MEFFIVTGIALFVIAVVIGVAAAVHSTRGAVRPRGGRSGHSTWADGGGGGGCGGSSSCGSGGSSCGGGGCGGGN